MILKNFIFWLMLLFISSCQPVENTNQPEYTLRFGHLANENHIWHKAALKFAEEVSLRSDGRVAVKVYPNEQLGKEMDMITGILGGSMDLMVTAESLENWSLPYAILCATPYAIRDSDHLQKVAGGPIGKEIEAHILKISNLRPIAWFERGARNLTSNVPIRHPDDLQNMILRVPNVSLFVEIWSALGAKPTPMAFSEVFTSLQQSTIHGQENPLDLIRNGGLYEVQKYINLTEHVKGWAYVVMGNKKFERMPPDLQQVILESAKVMQAYEHGLFREQEERDVQFLKEKGMEFIEADKAAFEKLATAAVINSFSENQNQMFQKNPGSTMKGAGLGRLDKILEWAVTISFMLMIVVVMIQVVSRNALPWSPHWTEELARFCFSYMVSLGAGLAVKDGAYVNVTLLLDRISGPLRFYMDSLILLGIMSLMVCMLIYSLPLIEIVSLQKSAALQINMAFIYFSMTAMSLFITLYAGAQLRANFIKFQQTL